MKVFSPLPQHVENISIGLDSQQYVGHRHVLEFALFSVGEVDFRLPDGLDEVRVVEVQGLGDSRVIESRIFPVLPQVQVHLVVLLTHVTLIF